MREKLPFASNYQQLLAYKIAVELADDVYKESKSFPKEEVYSLTDQIRRSSRSIGAQIAEAWGKRLYIKHFKSKLTDAIAEINETEHWIEMAYRCEYISNLTRNELNQTCNRIKTLIHGMIRKAGLFCEKIS